MLRKTLTHSSQTSLSNLRLVISENTKISGLVTLINFRRLMGFFLQEGVFMLGTNVDRLVKLSVAGDVVSPVFRIVYRISAGGVPMVLPGVGGITYNVRVGDPACGWEADHVEPGVSIENKENDSRYGLGANTALNVLSCTGNGAIIMSGDAKASKGIVVGKHGGIEHVLVDFPAETMEKMTIGDKVLVRSFGTGLKLLDYPEVTVMNIDPRFLDALDLKPKADKLEIPVTHTVPAATMGARALRRSTPTPT